MCVCALLLKSMQSDTSGMSVEGVFCDNKHAQQLDAVICEHLLRQGRMDIGELIIQVRVLLLINIVRGKGYP